LKRQLILGVIVTLIGVLLASGGVLDWPHTFVIIAIVMGLDYCLRLSRSRTPEPWPLPPVRFRGGARTEVARLAWATVDHNGDVSPKIMQRVRKIAQVSLAHHGVTWSGNPGDPMTPSGLAQQLVGAAAVETLTTARKVRPRTLESAVRQLEQLTDGDRNDY